MNNRNVVIGLLIFGLAFLTLVLFLNKPAHSAGAVYVDRSGQTIVWENTILTMNQAAQKRVCVYVGYGNVNLTLPDNPYDGFSLQVMKYGGTNTLAVYPNGTAAIVDASGTYVYNTSDATATYPTITLMYNAALNLWVKAGQTGDWIVAGDRPIVLKSNVQWITSVTGDLVLTTLQASGIINVDTTSDDIDLTLPTSVYNGFETTISKTGENTLAILAAGTDRIQDASATYVYNNEDTSGNSVSITFKYDSSNGRWMIKNQIGSWVIVNEWDVDVRTYGSGLPITSDGSTSISLPYLAMYSNDSRLISVTYSSDASTNCGNVELGRARGSLGSAEIPINGDSLGTIYIGGAATGGTVYMRRGLEWVAYGEWDGTTSHMPTSLKFYLSNDGATQESKMAELFTDNSGTLKVNVVMPYVDGAYCLGDETASAPIGYKGIVLRDQSQAKHYMLYVDMGVLTITEITDE